MTAEVQVGGAQPRRPTMSDVAARAGVSRALVSIVFRDQPGAGAETRVRVRAAAEEIGYRPDARARLLSRKHTRLLGVSFGVVHEFHAAVVTELYAAAESHGYELVLSGVTPARNEKRAVQDLLSFRCDAVIMLGPAARPSELTATGRHTPTIVIARATSAEGVDVVRTDDVTGARLATRHLLELGHRRIIHVDGGRAPGASERRRGYQAAMRAAGLEGLITIVPGGLGEDDGSRAAARLLAGPGQLPATAATVFNDASAIGFLATVRGAGVDVPGQLSVIGYDDSRLARASWASLTTIGQDMTAMARIAVERAVDRIDGQPPGHPALVRPTLVERSTTAPPGS